MTTTNHTDIVLGAAANADIINAPLGELDAAIGDLTTLGTTPKTSIVGALGTATPTTTAQTVTGALNELDALVGTAASVSGSIGTSIDTDGTLKAGAVDVTAVLANDVVDNTKLANMARGTVKVGGSANAPTDLVANSSGYILVGDATDIKSVAISGAITLTAAGVTALAADVVTLTKLYNITQGSIIVGGVVDPAELNVKTAGNILVGTGTTLASVAMSGDATLASSGALSLATTATVQPNAMWDPFGAHIAPDSNFADGRARWYQGTNLSAVCPDATNPYDAVTATTLRLAGAASLGGWYVYCDEIGAAEGAVLQARITAKAASGDRWQAKIVWRNSGGSTGSTVSSAVSVDNGLTQTLTLTSVARPADADRCLLYISRYAGSGANAIDIYERGVTLGSRITTLPMLAVDTNWLAQEMVAARGSLSTLGTRLAVSLNDDGTLKLTNGFSADLDVYGRHLLHDWQSQIAKIQQADSTSQAVIACIGDSWTHATRFHTPLKSWLQTAYGDAGAGFCHAGDTTNVGGAPGGITTFTKTGTWVNTDSTAGTRGIALCDTNSTDTATPASIVWGSSVHTFVLHYMKQVTGGTFHYKVDSGAWVDVDTAAVAEAFATETVGSLDGNSHTFTLEVTGAGTAGVKILGLDCQKTGNGVRVSDIANNGSASGDWVAVDATIWEAGLTALAPNLCIVMLGINDRGSSVPAATYYTNLATLVTRIKAALPLCDVLLIAPGDRSSGTPTAQAYVDEVRSLAVAQSVSCLDALLNLGTYANANTRGLYADTVHLNAFGGQLLANLVTERVLRVS